MSSPSPLECLAHGSCNGIFADVLLPIFQTGVGGIVGASAAGTYTITLDPGVVGNDVSILRSRVFIQPINSAANTNVNAIVKSIVAGLPPAVPLGGQFRVSFTIQVGAGAAADSTAFDWAIYRDPTETTAPGT